MRETMGLAERRAIKAFQENKFASLKKDLDKAAGKELLMEIDWDSLAVDDYAEQYDDYLPKVFFKPLIEALKAITFDEMGKEAIQEGLKKVVIRHSGKRQATFENGLLVLDLAPNSNVDYWEDRRNEWQKILEKGL